MKHLQVNIDLFETNKKEILKNINFILNENDRIALVWPNWAGKTTLFKIITWEITEFSGKIQNTWSMTLGYLAQIHFDNEDRLVIDELRRAFVEILELEKQLDIAEEKMKKESSNLEVIEEYSNILDKYNNIGGYKYDYEIHRVANWLGIVELLNKKIVEVSWWQRTKIALAKTILQKPDFLFFDEPTNFIDLASTEWLEKYLANTWKWWYMIISHDRNFLDKTCDKTFEITWPRPLVQYAGNYTYYVKEKEKSLKIAMDDWERQDDYINSQTKLINRFRAWSRAWWAKSREKMIEKMDLIEKPIISKKPKFSFEFFESSGNRILFFKDVFIGRKEPLFYIRELELTVWQKIWIVWENWVGKSTFIKTILGQIEQLEWIISKGKDLRISYYSQLHEELDKEKTLRENFEKYGFDYSKEKLVAIITNYLFTIDDIDKKVKDFSGWQISKLLFAILWQKESNFLVFDEPTNHLDYEFREALENELLKYKWTILFISHDRYFINKIATHLWLIKDDELLVSYGNYEDLQYKLERWLSLDDNLFNEAAELDIVLEEKLWEREAKRIREKYGKKRK